MRTLVSVFLLIPIFSCQPSSSDTNKDYVQYLDDIIAQLSMEMQQQYDLICIGDGGALCDCVKSVAVMFVAYRHVNESMAREMEVTAIQRFLHLINSHKELQKDLYEKPFPSNRIEISIAFYTANDSYHLDGSVAYVSSINGRLYYKRAEMRTLTTIPTINMTDHPLDTSIREYKAAVTFPLFDESYEEALKIVQGDK